MTKKRGPNIDPTPLLQSRTHHLEKSAKQNPLTLAMRARHSSRGIQRRKVWKSDQGKKLDECGVSIESMDKLSRRHVLTVAASSAASAALPAPVLATIIDDTIATTVPSTSLLDDVFTVIERQTDISRTAILSNSRERDIVRARHRAMYVYRLLSGRSLPEIGRRLGGRSHMTAIYACRRIERYRRTNAGDQEIDDLIHACIVEAVRNGHRLTPDFNRGDFKQETILLDVEDRLDPLWR